MKKISTLFVRDFSRDNGRYVTDEVTPGCEWVLAGEGVATRKYDGTCIRVENGPVYSLWARREVKAGKPAPEGFQVVETDETTGKTVGWEPWSQSSFAKYIEEARKNWAEAHLMGLARVGLYPLYASLATPTWLRLLGARIGRDVEASTVIALPRMTTVDDGAFLADDTMVGTYELCGPKINGNPEGYDQHVLIPHARADRLGGDWDLSSFDEIRKAVLHLRSSLGFEGIVWHHPDGRMAKIKARDFPSPVNPGEQQ